MVLQGEKIKLIPIGEEDTDDIIRWRNNVRDQFIYRELFTADSHTKWLNEVVRRGQAVQYIIHSDEDGRIGSVFLRDIDKKNQKAEYGIFIGEISAQGKGYGSAAAKLMIQYGFEYLKLHKIMLRVFPDNYKAIKSYEKAGFSKEGYLKDDVCIDNKYCDIILMGIIRHDNSI